MQVHYGRASLSKLSRLPAFFVFPQQQLDVEAAAASLAASSPAASGNGPVLVFVDQPLLHLLPQLAAAARLHAPAVQWIFPEVPTRELEPEVAAGSAPRAGGTCCQGQAACCSPTEQQQQQQPPPQRLGEQLGWQQRVGEPAACCAGAACTATDGLPAASSSDHHHQQQQQQQEPGSHPPSPGTSAGGTGGGATSSGSGFSSSIAGYQWALPSGAAPQACSLVWVGDPQAPAVTQLQLTYNSQPWVLYDPQSATWQEGLPATVGRTLRRRYYLVQKARDARIVGILVGTLGVAGYAAAIDGLRAAAAAAGKKAYTVLVGKPSPAKLANFPEVEVWVMVADPQGQVGVADRSVVGEGWKAVVWG